MFYGGAARRLTCAGLVASAFFQSGCSDSPPSTEAPPLLIANVEIVDGSGGAPFVGSVRVVAGVITEIGDVARSDRDMVYSGRGLVLAPGFIDTHSHADSDIAENPDALAAVSQGITTAVVGQDGSSRYPLTEFIAEIEATGSAINIASYAGHNTVRESRAW